VAHQTDDIRYRSLNPAVAVRLTKLTFAISSISLWHSECRSTLSRHLAALMPILNFDL
jgi:hypothetical protein